LSPIKALIRHAAGHGIPALGICLGHQLAAVALGGEVVTNPAGKRRGALEMGWLPAAQDDPVLSGCGRRGVQWHRDLVTRIPDGTCELARAHTGELLAARFAPTVWGVQSHPEADTDIVETWAAWDRGTASSAAEVKLIDQALSSVHACAEELQSGWRPLVSAFAEQVKADGRPVAAL
jgi:GMP synthase (glutamine-hydrolysing)